MSYKGLMGVNYRLARTDMFHDLYRCGAAIDAEAAIQITQYAWVNDMNLDLIQFDVAKVDFEEDY